MKRSWLIVAVLLAVTMIAVYAAAQKTMSVAVQVTQIRSSASYGNNILGTVKFADKVSVLAQPTDAPKGWLYVQSPDGKLKGWVNLAALVEKDIQLAPVGSVRQGASTGDVSLAGKGFAEAETDFVSTNSVNEAGVDSMQQYTVTFEAILDFISWGGLIPVGGSK